MFIASLVKPKPVSSTNQDRKGSKTAPIDSTFVSYSLFISRILK
jgi:hypothetical protein